MILSESDKEKMSSGQIYLVAENAKIKIHDGKIVEDICYNNAKEYFGF